MGAETDRFCGDAERGIRVYCHPKHFAPVALSLYHNRRDGRFEDASVASGIARHRGRGMAVAFADYDQDGFVDFYVTNDKLPSFLFRNLGDGRFEERALLAGPALPEHGGEISAMGVDFRDYDNDGLPDLHVTALAGEGFPLFRNLGKGQFQDVSYRSQLAAAVQARSGWSNALVDLDNDGFKDLFTANSHVNDAIDRFQSNSYRETNSVFRNLGDGRFEDLSEASGLAAAPRQAHRGAAFGDLDGDGRIDVVVSALGAPAELWRNESSAGHWLELRLVGTKSNRDGIGAVVKLEQASGTRWRAAVEPRDDGLRLRLRQRRPAAFRPRPGHERRPRRDPLAERHASAAREGRRGPGRHGPRSALSEGLRKTNGPERREAPRPVSGGTRS